VSFQVYLASILLASTALYFIAKSRALSLKSTDKLTSTPGYHGLYVFLLTLAPTLVFLIAGSLFENTFLQWLVIRQIPADLMLDSYSSDYAYNQIINVANGIIAIDPSNLFHILGVDLYEDAASFARQLKLAIILSIFGLLGCYGYFNVSPKFNARISSEEIVHKILGGVSLIAVLTTFGILFSILFETIMFFQSVSVTEFLFGTQWSPQTAIRADQVGSSGAFGALPVFTGTFLIALIAMLVAIPFGLLSAIYLSEYATSRIKDFMKPMLEVLAGIPTVVYGYFAALYVGPFFRKTGGPLPLNLTSESALAVGLVMGVMIIPFVSSISSDVISAVPRSLREGSYGCGATKSETISYVVIPAALPGIIAGILLAVSRAIGETMIVVMAAGLAANLTLNPLQPVTTVTAQIVTLLVGDQEFDSPKTLAAFALGLVLFIVTLILNIIALRVVRKYREQYE
jgi:phosphate transport system permease protein